MKFISILLAVLMLQGCAFFEKRKGPTTPPTEPPVITQPPPVIPPVIPPVEPPPVITQPPPVVPPPIIPPPEPIPVPPPITDCGGGLAARDLAGNCRANPPTPGALEAVKP